jgi:RNA-directed DNA polymerase
MRTTPSTAFQHEHEALAFLDDLEERMRKFELALHPDKTRLIRFGRHAAKQREKLGEGKAETSTSWTSHISARDHANGAPSSSDAKTTKKRMRAKLLAIKIQLHRAMHDPIAKTGAWIKQMLNGHMRRRQQAEQVPAPPDRPSAVSVPSS